MKTLRFSLTFELLTGIIGLTAASGLEPCCRAVSVLNAGPAGSTVTGVLEFHQDGASASTLTIRGEIKGLPPNSTHGFHIHESGDLRNRTNPCLSTGPHYNPLKHFHGSPVDTDRHAGDLGNIYADENGVASIQIEDSVISLTGAYSILGRAVVVHEKIDDLGREGGDSKNTGNAGARVACGVVGTIYEKPLEVRYIYGLHRINTVTAH